MYSADKPGTASLAGCPVHVEVRNGLEEVVFHLLWVASREEETQHPLKGRSPSSGQ